MNYTQEQKLKLLSIPDYYPLNTRIKSEAALEQILIEGEGLYWDLQWNNNTTEILTIVPYSVEQVIENLFRLVQIDKQQDDVLFDFNSRQ